MIDRVILGTVQLGVPYGINNEIGKPDDREAHNILNFANEIGIKTLDTARAYGSAIEVIGNYHLNSDYKYKVISKFFSLDSESEREVKAELVLLNINQFEAYLFHSFSEFETVSSKTTDYLSNLKKEDLINKIGVSVYGNDQFKKAIESPITDIIQLPYNLLDNACQRKELMTEAKQNGKELHIRSVFLQGLFFMQNKIIPQKISPLKPYLKQLGDIAAKENMSMQEMALGYVLHNPLIDKVLIGVDSVAHLKSNFKAIKKVQGTNKFWMEEIDAIEVKEKELLSPPNWN